jgi:hypothetical protein
MDIKTERLHTANESSPPPSTCSQQNEARMGESVDLQWCASTRAKTRNSSGRRQHQPQPILLSPPLENDDRVQVASETAPDVAPHFIELANKPRLDRHNITRVQFGLGQRHFMAIPARAGEVGRGSGWLVGMQHGEMC